MRVRELHDNNKPLALILGSLLLLMNGVVVLILGYRELGFQGMIEFADEYLRSKGVHLPEMEVLLPFIGVGAVVLMVLFAFAGAYQFWGLQQNAGQQEVNDSDEL